MLCNNSYTLWMLYTYSQESGGAQCHTKVFYHSVCSDDTFRSTSGDNGLYAMNEFNHYAEIASRYYTEVGEEGQGEETPVEYKNSSHAEVCCFSIIMYKMHRYYSSTIGSGNCYCYQRGCKR